MASGGLILLFSSLVRADVRLNFRFYSISRKTTLRIAKIEGIASMHLKFVPFKNRTKDDHSKTEQVQFSDPHCICFMNGEAVYLMAPYLIRYETN